MKHNYRFSMEYLIKYWLSYMRAKNFAVAGFTLIELIVVFLILGILAAVSTPVFFAQIGKSRESELLITMGSIARTQQSYHFLYGKFALTMAEIEAESGKVSVKYYDLDNITGGTSGGISNVKVQGIALNPGKDQVRNYAIGVYFNNGAFDRATCQGALIGSAVQVGDLPSDPCTNNGTKIN